MKKLTTKANSNLNFKMSNTNIEEGFDVPISQKETLSSSHLNNTNNNDLLQVSQLPSDMKDINSVSSLYGSTRLNMNDLNSSKSSIEPTKHKGLKIDEIRKKELKQAKGKFSPPSLNTTDLSYKILNEILNTQHGDRSQLRSKLNTKTFEHIKENISLNGTAESGVDLFNHLKTLPEESEEIKMLQARIDGLTGQLQGKLNLYEKQKKALEDKNNNIQ